MPISRRNFIRTIVAGTTAAGLPFERVYGVAPDRASAVPANRRHIVREPGHQIRDGRQFAGPPRPSSKTL